MNDVEWYAVWAAVAAVAAAAGVAMAERTVRSVPPPVHVADEKETFLSPRRPPAPRTCTACDLGTNRNPMTAVPNGGKDTRWMPPAAECRDYQSCIGA